MGRISFRYVTRRVVRTALAVNRAGSITAGAKDRTISQPAASQQIALLEQALGIQLFERHRSGVRATADGARFLGQVAGPFDEIEWLLGGLDAGRVELQNLPVTIGCQPEWFQQVLLPHYSLSIPLRTRFASDTDLLDELQRGRIDIAVTLVQPNTGRLKSQHCGDAQYRLVSPKGLAPTEPLSDFRQVGQWIAQTPWVGFSEELPTTRRFWAATTGSVQPTNVALVAPDLRLVLQAVEQGLGASLLPADLCQRSIREGRLVDIYPGNDMLAPATRLVSVRRDAADQTQVDQVVATILDAH